MFAKMIKSSSPLASLRQLFRLKNTVSSLNSPEHGPPLEPCKETEPLRRNFLALLIISFGVPSLSVISTSAMVCHFREMHESKSVICCHGNYPLELKIKARDQLAFYPNSSKKQSINVISYFVYSLYSEMKGKASGSA